MGAGGNMEYIRAVVGAIFCSGKGGRTRVYAPPLCNPRLKILEKLADLRVSTSKYYAKILRSCQFHGCSFYKMRIRTVALGFSFRFHANETT